MKTSKIIFISVLGIIALFILLAFADIRINGLKIGSDGFSDITAKRHELPAYRFLKIDNSNIVFMNKDSSGIEIRSYNKIDKAIGPDISYKISGDTLYISDTKRISENKQINMSIICYSNSLEGIISHNSAITINKFKNNRLSLDMNNSYTGFNMDIASLNMLNIKATNKSQISANNFNIDTMKIELRNSEADFESNIRKLTGTLRDSSRINFPKVEDISMKLDESSHISSW